MSLPLTITLEDFVHFATYPFGNVSLVRYPAIAAAIQQADPTGVVCHYDPETWTLHTAEDWIAESQRRSERDRITEEIRQQRTTTVVAPSDSGGVTLFNIGQKIQEAMMKNDMVEMARLQKMLEQFKP